MRGIIKHKPFKRLIVPPFDKLRVLLTHKEKLFAGMTHHICVKCFQI